MDKPENQEQPVSQSGPIKLGPEGLRRAKQSWAQALADQKEARGLAGQDGLRACFAAVQSATGALGVVCRLNGHLQLPLHDAQELVLMCLDADPAFEPLLETVGPLDEAMMADPFVEGPSPLDPQTVRRCLAASTQVVEQVRGYLYANRSRWFKP